MSDSLQKQLNEALERAERAEARVAELEARVAELVARVAELVRRLQRNRLRNRLSNLLDHAILVATKSAGLKPDRRRSSW